MAARGPETKNRFEENPPDNVPNRMAEPTLAVIPKATHSALKGEIAIKP